MMTLDEKARILREVDAAARANLERELGEVEESHPGLLTIDVDAALAEMAAVEAVLTGAQEPTPSIAEAIAEWRAHLGG